MDFVLMKQQMEILKYRWVPNQHEGLAGSFFKTVPTESRGDEGDKFHFEIEVHDWAQIQGGLRIEKDRYKLEVRIRGRARRDLPPFSLSFYALTPEEFFEKREAIERYLIVALERMVPS